MKVDHEIPVRTLRARDKEFEDVSPSIWKGLEDQRATSRLIPGILEDNHVMRIARNGLGKFPRWKQILTQVQDRNVSMMGFSRKEIQHAFIVSSFIHEIVQDQHPTLRKPCLKIGDVRDSFVKLDALTFHAIEPGLPYGVTVMTRSCLSALKHGAFRQERFGQLRLATSRRTDNHRTTGHTYHDKSKKGREGTLLLKGPVVYRRPGLYSHP